VLTVVVFLFLITSVLFLLCRTDIGVGWTEPVDVAGMIQPPPRFNTPAYEADVAAAERWFVLRDPDRVGRAVKDMCNRNYLERLSGVLGVSLDAEVMRETRAVLMRMKALSEKSVAPVKAGLDRERPWRMMGHPPVCTGEGSPVGHSYPSGHATWAWLAGYVLADALPHREKALLVVAADYSESQEVCLLHWHSDIVAGQLSAQVIHRALTRRPAYQSALNRIRNEYLDARAAVPGDGAGRRQ